MYAMAAKKRSSSGQAENDIATGAVAPEELKAEFPEINLPIRPPFSPAEAKSVDEIPSGENWQFEPKWDGFRCLAFRDGDTVAMQSKSGQPLGRYFPELIQALVELLPQKYVLDGEIVIEREGQLSFDDLLMRIHPAESRIRRLSRETPSTLLVFDLLVDENGEPLLGEPLRQRRKHVERFVRGMGRTERVQLSPATTDRATAVRWMSELAGAGFDGVIAKDLEASYASGERTAMRKIKRMRTADCVIGGFRWAAKGGEVGSLLLGLYDDQGLLHHVGFTSGFRGEQRKELKHILKSHMNGTGFTGRAPGGPSRWSTERSGEWERLDPKLVIEVQYDHFSGDRFRHGTRFLRWRPDKDPSKCGFDQVRIEPAKISELIKAA
ncbi:MAG TPA: ATP-dependent DNA ligase [Terriglobales bacterium]|nr:ATP-dependent DNA ligase [Terriglobales bacterium]